jgi:Putative auto-transporter adhesin, head GIN domain
MKPFAALLLLFVTLANFSVAQESTHDLPPFSKIIVSPHVNVVLQKGTQESIKLMYANITEEEINVRIKNGKLLIYLDDSRFFEKQEKYHKGEVSFKHSRYRDATVTAVITYQQLNGLVVRGEQEVDIDDTITSDKFKLKVYGEAEVRFASLSANHFKAKMYGGNRLKIMAGEIQNQKYRLYGGNKIDTRAIESQVITSVIYGEGLMRVNATDQLVLTSIGEPKIQLSGGAHIYKGIVIGTPHISKGL